MALAPCVSMLLLIFAPAAKTMRVRSSVIAAFREAEGNGMVTSFVAEADPKEEDVNGRRRTASATAATSGQVEANGTSKVSDSVASLVAFQQPGKRSAAIGGLNRFPKCTDRCCRCTARFANTNTGTVEVNVMDLAGGCNAASMQEYVIHNATKVPEPRARVKEVQSDCVQSFAKYDCSFTCTYVVWRGARKHVTLYGTGAGDTMMRQVVYEQHDGCSSGVKGGSVSTPCMAV